MSVKDNTVLLLQTLPQIALPPCALVDFLHFVACDKPAVRTRLENLRSLRQVGDWCSTSGLSMAADGDHFICIARKATIAERILEIDRKVTAHTYELGRALGYPDCCSRFVGKIGEAKIDSLDEKVTHWNFNGIFKLIDPSGYLSGDALICHIPCSPNCETSLRLALRALHFIKANQYCTFMARWGKWLEVDIKWKKYLLKK